MKFKKIGKIHLIIIVSIALTIISAGMSKIPSTIDGVIKDLNRARTLVVNILM